MLMPQKDTVCGFVQPASWLVLHMQTASQAAAAAAAAAALMELIEHGF